MSGGEPSPVGDATRGRGVVCGRGPCSLGDEPPDPPLRGHPRALIWPASLKSASVRPPSECVDSVSVTLFHWMRMSG
jgi:hypothetical protein